MNRGPSREKVERVVELYRSCRGPERAWNAISGACGYGSGQAVKEVLEKYAPIFRIDVPGRQYEHMTQMERNLVEAEIDGQVTQPAAERLYQKAPFEIERLPDIDLPVEEIIAHRKREFLQKKAHEEARRLISVKIKIDGPIGILHFGDPHVDDDGTDIIALERHSDMTRTVEGLFGANVGDTTNNWIGRLARLYADQSMGRRRAIKVAEWFIRRTVWLYMIGGNHDGWSGDDDPIKWISKQVDALYQPTEARLGLKFPNGETVIINARHDFAGSSQWNPAHGPMKAIQMGLRDDISVAGHKHESGYGVLKDPETQKICHALKVASYKVYDRYAKDKGFRDQALGPAAVTVIDPYMPLTHPDRIHVFWDPEEGANYLAFKRARQRMNKPKSLDAAYERRAVKQGLVDPERATFPENRKAKKSVIRKPKRR